MKSKSLHITFDLIWSNALWCFFLLQIPSPNGPRPVIIIPWDSLQWYYIKYKVERCLYLIISWTGWLTAVDMAMSHPDPPSRTGSPRCWEGSWQIAFSCQPLQGLLWLEEATSPKVMPLYWLFISNDALMPSWESLKGHFGSRGFPRNEPKLLLVLHHNSSIFSFCLLLLPSPLQ